MIMNHATRRQLLGSFSVFAAAAPGVQAAAATPPLVAAADVSTATGEAAFQPTFFRSFFLGGFECSTHRRADGRRLDLIAATDHDVQAEQDYRQLAGHGIRSVRDGVRWHLVETSPGHYDWSSLLSMLRAAEAAKTEVVWDLCHYGWPDGLDVFSAAFVHRFAQYAASFARLHMAETGRPPSVCPINEISFLAWAGGDVGIMNPLASGRGDELKRQLARATIAAAHAIREAAPGARVIAIDPLINIIPRQGQDPRAVAAVNEKQFQAWDMLSGRLEPGLGGEPDLLDAIGVNYYWNNQWLHEGEREAVLPSDDRHRPLRALLAGAYARYRCPMFMSETSIEGDARAGWLRYIGEELRAAVRGGVPLEGICLYPVLSHPGWDDERYCPNGLLEMRARGSDRRLVHAPLATELRNQQDLFQALFASS